MSCELLVSSRHGALRKLGRDDVVLGINDAAALNNSPDNAAFAFATHIYRRAAQGTHLARMLFSCSRDKIVGQIRRAPMQLVKMHAPPLVARVFQRGAQLRRELPLPLVGRALPLELRLDQTPVVLRRRSGRAEGVGQKRQSHKKKVYMDRRR